MISKLKLFIRAWKESERFQKLKQDDRSIVFYDEDAATMMYFESIIEELSRNKGRSICYLTSAPDDPVLNLSNSKIKAFYVGRGVVRTALFMNLKVGVLVMTMPDLENLYIKRSRVYPVHYVYTFHNLVSTHLIFLKGAFDHYDTILCASSHHIREIRATENVYKLKAKNLIKNGYGRLDKLLEEKARYESRRTNEYSEKKQVLVAPSWGKYGLLETALGIKLVEILIKAGYHVIVRPHPCTLSKWPKTIKMLESRFRNNPHFVLERDIRKKESFFSSYCMISDWSGAAIEYAFTMMRPVIYIDVPTKVRNPHYKEIPLEPLDFSIRSKIGLIISPNDLSSVPDKIESIYADISAFKDQIRKARSQMVFNIGKSGIIGAEAIAEIVDRRN